MLINVSVTDVIMICWHVLVSPVGKVALVAVTIEHLCLQSLTWMSLVASDSRNNLISDYDAIGSVTSANWKYYYLIRFQQCFYSVSIPIIHPPNAERRQEFDGISWLLYYKYDGIHTCINKLSENILGTTNILCIQLVTVLGFYLFSGIWSGSSIWSKADHK